jgi:hypothetical protein
MSVWRLKSENCALPTAHTSEEPGTTATALRPVVRSRRPPDGGTGSTAPLPALHVEPFQWRTCGSRALLVEPTAQMSAGERPAAPLTDAQMGVAAGVSKTSPNTVPAALERIVSVRPWQPVYDDELALPTPQTLVAENGTSPPSVLRLPGFGDGTMVGEAAAGAAAATASSAAALNSRAARHGANT